MNPTLPPASSRIDQWRSGCRLFGRGVVFLNRGEKFPAADDSASYVKPTDRRLLLWSDASRTFGNS
jgi:hypothetical protein